MKNTSLLITRIIEFHTQLKTSVLILGLINKYRDKGKVVIREEKKCTNAHLCRVVVDDTVYNKNK